MNAIILRMSVPIVSVVVPVFEEEENLPELYRRLCGALDPLVETFELVFVDDGSQDETEVMLGRLRAEDPRVVVVRLSRNFGHQAAISAGLTIASGRAVVIMDGDLQDPPEVLHQFISAWQNGYDVVYAVRTKRKEGLMRRGAYALFYRCLSAISDIEIPLDSGDFCLMDRRVVDVLNHLPERNRFVRGLRTFVGFRQVGIPYERAARAAGERKYSMTALIRLAIDGLVSFSSYPLQLATYFGFATAGVSILLTGWAFYDVLHNRQTPRGWASTLIVVLAMSSVQLISLGIIGEYLRRIFIESKQRPGYIIQSLERNDTAGDRTTIRS